MILENGTNRLIAIKISHRSDVQNYCPAEKLFLEILEVKLNRDASQQDKQHLGTLCFVDQDEGLVRLLSEDHFEDGQLYRQHGPTPFCLPARKICRVRQERC